jgi:hypothetical protein
MRVVTWALAVWYHIVRLFRSVLGLDAPPQYGHEPSRKLRVVGPDGKPFVGPNGEDWSNASKAVAYVSRHGLQERGITCPACSALAVAPGQWERVQQTRRGEAVTCHNCLRTLFASPDDDLDPVSRTEPYDESIYHSFVRPASSAILRPRTTTHPVGIGSRVLLEGEHALRQKLDGAEALVISEEGTDSWRVALNGNDGFAGSDLGGSFVTIPKSDAFEMVNESICIGDEVTCWTLDRSVERVGRVLAFKQGDITVRFGTDEQPVVWPIERMCKLITGERPRMRSHHKHLHPV